MVTHDLFSHFKETRISIVVPVFNEEKNIRFNLETLISEVEPFFSKYEILVVSDGSTDQTGAVLKKFEHPKVKSIVLEKNRGKGHAVRCGFKEAQGEFILFIDGGMELHPKAIRTFLVLQALYEADIVIGSKRHPQSHIDYPLTRRVLSYTYQKIIKKLFDLDVTDTQVGIKLFKREVIDAVLPTLSIDRYGFDLELLATAKKKGFSKMLEAPIQLDYFSKNVRPFFSEIFHIFKVGSEILKDTWKVYRRLNS